MTHIHTHYSVTCVSLFTIHTHCKLYAHWQLDLETISWYWIYGYCQGQSPSVSEDDNGAYGRVSCRVSPYSKDLKDCNNCNTYLFDAVPVHVLYVFRGYWYIAIIALQSHSATSTFKLLQAPWGSLKTWACRPLELSCQLIPFCFV